MAPTEECPTPHVRLKFVLYMYVYTVIYVPYLYTHAV